MTLTRIQRHRRGLTVICATAIAVASIGTPVHAKDHTEKTKTEHFPVHVETDGGLPLEGALVIACPIADPQGPCPTAFGAYTNAAGVAILEIPVEGTFNMQAIVSDPDPEWACPGLPFNGREHYFSINQFTTGASDFPKQATFIVEFPVNPRDCWPVPVVDQYGEPVGIQTTAFFCRIEDGGCTPLPYPPSTDDGTLHFDTDEIEADALYRLEPFVINSGWPCPNTPSGQFHFGPKVEVTGAVLTGGTFSLFINHPELGDC